MDQKEEKKVKFKNLSLWSTILLFIGCFLYLWLLVDPKLLFHSGGKITNYPVFFKGMDFFMTFLKTPGGPAQYLAAFLAQGLFYSILGACVLIATAAAICFALRSIIKKCNIQTAGWFWLLPLILLSIVYGRYSFNFVTTVALLISLTTLVIYLKIAPQITAGRLIIFSALALISYLLSAGPFLVFAVSAILYDTLIQKQKKITIPQIIISVLIPYFVGFQLIGQPLVDAFTALMPFNWQIIIHEDARSSAIFIYILYALTPISIIALAILNAKPTIKTRTMLPKIFNFKTWQNNLIVLLIAALLINFTFDRKVKLLFLCDYHSCHKNWDKVVKVAKKQLNSLLMGASATRALYHQGLLFDKMFEFYQFPTVLFMEPKGQSKIFWKQADLYLDLGYINMADHKWSGCLDAFGPRPLVLKRLAWINLIKANPQSARIYLNSLKRTFFYNDFADKYLNLLETDPQLLTDTEIQKYRKYLFHTDYSRDFGKPELALNYLLQTDPNNKMAYEYMMSWFLLTKELNEFAQALSYMEFYNYSKLPQCFEDAIMIYQSRTRSKLDLPGNLKISNDAARRYSNFSSICSAYQSNEAILFNQLKGEYGNSYLFYFLFNRSGMKP